MRWDEFLDTAERLAKGKTEGDWRSAASRAYYAVFHYFRDLFRGQGVNIGSSAQDHNSIYAGLNNCGVAAVSPIARRVDELRRLRGRADYDLHIPFDQQLALDSVYDARTIVSDFQALLNTVPLAQIIAGARAYLRSIGRIP